MDSETSETLNFITDRQVALEKENLSLKNRLDAIESATTRQKTLDSANMKKRNENVKEVDLKIEKTNEYLNELKATTEELHNKNKKNSDLILPQSDEIKTLQETINAQAADIVQIQDNQRGSAVQQKYCDIKIDELKSICGKFEGWSDAIQQALEQFHNLHNKKMSQIFDLFKNNYEHQMLGKQFPLIDPSDTTGGPSIIPIPPTPPPEKFSIKDTFWDVMGAIIPPLDPPERIEKIK